VIIASLLVLVDGPDSPRLKPTVIVCRYGDVVSVFAARMTYCDPDDPVSAAVNRNQNENHTADRYAADPGTITTSLVPSKLIAVPEPLAGQLL
jgi:hypothetical protein